MKILCLNILIIFLTSCGMDAKQPKAKKDGLTPGVPTLNLSEDLEYDDVPAAMIMVWFPDTGYYNQFNANFYNTKVSSASELRNQCISTVPKNSELMLRALESFYGSSTSIKNEIHKNTISKNIIDGKYKLIKNEISDLGCEANEDGVELAEECVEMLKKKSEIKEQRSALKKKIGLLGNELRMHGGIYRKQLIGSLKEFQVLCDPIVDWENASSEEKDQQKVNLVYPTNEGSPEELGYVMRIDTKDDFEIQFPAHTKDKISYSSDDKDFKIKEIVTTSNGRRVITLEMIEKTINGLPTGAIIEFELVENKIFGMLRYEGEITKIHNGVVVKKGAVKFEFSAI